MKLLRKDIMDNQGVKQVIVIRKDLNMRKGKMVSQGAHASLGALLQCFDKDEIKKKIDNKEIISGYDYRLLFEPETYFDKWLNGLFTKICLYVESEKELTDLYNQIKKESNIPCVMIEDSGLTEFHGIKTKTCIGIGPYWSKEIDKFTKDLKLL